MKEAKTLKKHRSQLQDAVNVILKVVSILIVPLGIGLFCSQRFQGGMSYSEAIVNTVAAVLGMIPEGLVLLISIGAGGRCGQSGAAEDTGARAFLH